MKKSLHVETIATGSVALLMLLFVASASAEASVTIAENIKSRDHSERVSLELGEDGRSCTKATTEGLFKFSTQSEPDESEACTALKVARRIQQRVGSCSPQVSIEKDGSLLVLSGRSGISFANPHDTLWVRVSQECLCGRLVTVDSDIGLGSVNLINLFFDGPYYRSEVTLMSVSALECANFFDSEQEKKTVLEAYEEIYRLNS